MGGAVSTGRKNVTKIRTTSVEQQKNRHEENHHHNLTSPPSASNITQQNSHNSLHWFSPRDPSFRHQISHHDQHISSPYELNRISASPFPYRPSPLGHEHSDPSFSTPIRQPPSDGSQSCYNRSQLSHRSEESDHQTADVFAQTALSLGLDGDDLLFNMMFFDDGYGGTFGQVLNTMQQETLALHSENNTPYRLHPADEAAIAGLVNERFEMHVTGEEIECLVCRDELEADCEILRIPHCRHYFHQECLLRWIKMQAWCPVCRAPVGCQSSSKVEKMEPLVEAAEVVGNNTHSHRDPPVAARLPFPNLQEAEEDLSPISRKLAMEEQLFTREDVEEYLLPQIQAEPKSSTSSSPIRFYNIDSKAGETLINPDRDTPERKLATESADKIISDAVHSIYQEKLTA